MEQLITDYLAYLNIPISKRYCEKCIVSHPGYPSLLSIADTLERLGIDYQIGEVGNGIDDIPLPCIFQLDRRRGELLLVKDQSDLESHRSDLEHWNGIILKAEATDTITDEEHNKQFAREKRQQKLMASLGVALIGLFALPSLIAGISLGNFYLA